VQFNHPSPDIHELHKLKDRCPDIAIVFSIYESLVRAGHGVMAQRIRECRGAISYVLLDSSQGNGRNLDLQKAAEAYRVIADAAPGVTVGFAGGFSGENATERIGTLRSAIGNARFSIDAEGKLRTPSDDLNPANVRSYLQAAQRGFATESTAGS
jgi:phosphoribosylanthranilate isomerase